MDITTLDLPRHTHAIVLTGRDVVYGTDLHRVVVWADRIYTNCPRCGERIDREVEECPVQLNAGAGPGGALMDIDQKHGCGLWLSVGYTEVKPGPDVQPETCEDCESNGVNCHLHDGPEYDDEVAPGITADQVYAAAKELSDRWDHLTKTQQGQIVRDLAQDLRNALDALREPLDDDETMEDRIEEVSSGSEHEPGVYCDDDGNWQAWEYDPATDEPITVYARDLTAVTR